MNIEELLIEHGFTKYKHVSGFFVWSKEDLLATDYMKEWFYA